MHIEYMFIVQQYFIAQRYGFYRRNGTGFALRMGSPTGILGLRGAATRKTGAAKPAADQIVEDAF